MLTAHSTQFERWTDLFDKGMHQLARIEIRHVAERPGAPAEILFALGASELALRRYKEAERAFRRSADLLAKGGGAELPATCRQMGAVLARIFQSGELKKLAVPATIGYWLETPARVGERDMTPVRSGRLPARIESVKFVSALRMDSMKDLERRASTFSYDVFNLAAKERTGTARAEMHRDRTSTHTREAKSETRSSNTAVPRPKAMPLPAPQRNAPPPVPKAAQDGGWYLGPQAAPPHPAAAAVATTQPVGASATRFEVLATARLEQPPETNANDAWSKWENELYRLVLDGRIKEALERAKGAVDKYPASSRLREHDAYVRAVSGDSSGAINSWLETVRLANSTGADDRAELAARKALSIAWNDGPMLADVARQLAGAGRPDLTKAILAAAAERLIADNRLSAVEGIGIALAELAARDAASRPEVQRILSLVERVTGEDAASIARRIRERMGR